MVVILWVEHPDGRTAITVPNIAASDVGPITDAVADASESAAQTGSGCRTSAVADHPTEDTLTDLGRRYGIDKATVLRLIRQAGEPVRYPRFSASETARLVELYEAGLPQKDIAERLSRSQSAVCHCLQRLGLVEYLNPNQVMRYELRSTDRGAPASIA